MASLTVASLNLRGVHDRWWKREPVIVRGLAGLEPDVICLQEAATWCLQAHWLAWRLRRATGRRYRAFHTPKRGFRALFEGVAIVTDLQVRARGSTGLGGDGRVAQGVLLAVEGGRLVVVNAHLSHRSAREALRAGQAARVLAWAFRRGRPGVLAGDLNDVAGSPALQALAPALRPAFEAVGAAVPPTSPAWSPRRAIDHLLVTSQVAVVEAGTFLDRAEGGVWPSDHIGLWARLAVQEAR